MRKKTCPGRFKYARTTPAAPSASTCTKRLDFHNEDGSEKDAVPDTYSDGNDDIMSEDSEPMPSKSNPNEDLLPRTSHDGGSEENTASHQLGKKICLQCGKQMLACTETGCPVAFHEKCLTCKPKFDESGKYYCPYCTYKRAVEKVVMLRKKSMLAKNALSNFLNASRVGDGHKKQANSSPLGNRNYGNAEVGYDHNKQASSSPLGNRNNGNAEVDDGHKKRATSSPLGNRSHGNAEVGDCQEHVMVNGKDTSSSPHGKQNQGGDKVGHGILKAQKDGKVNGNQGSSTHLTNENQADEGIDIGNNRDDRQCMDQDYSEGHINQLSTSAREQDVEKGPSKPKVPSTKNSSAGKQIEIKKATDVTVTYAEKQKHLRWTKEEVEMLKEGVNKFSETKNKNIPWRKILEYGYGVFDPARRPMDLKEKWKKIVVRGH